MIKFALLALTSSVVQGQYLVNKQRHYVKREEGYNEKADDYTEPNYSFEYSVDHPNTGDIKNHKEERHGDNTQGVYSLMEPDGWLRTVKYSVKGKSGFLADVHREAPKNKAAPEPPASKPNEERSAERIYHKVQPAYSKLPQQIYFEPQSSYFRIQPRNKNVKSNSYKTQLHPLSFY